MRRFIAAMVIGSSLALSPMSSEGAVLVQPDRVVQSQSLDTLLDEANDGDKIILTEKYVGDFYTEKRLFLEGVNWTGGIFGSFTVGGSGDITFNRAFLEAPSTTTEAPLRARDSARLATTGSIVVGEGDLIDYNSTGGLSIQTTELDGNDYYNGASINLHKVAGNILVARNYLSTGDRAIQVFAEDLSGGDPYLTILNNTFRNYSGIALDFRESLSNTSLKLENNLVTDSVVGFKDSGGNALDALRFNDFHNNGTDISSSLFVLRTLSEGDNFFLDPIYLSQYSAAISPDSPLIGLGNHTPGLTTWFDGKPHTWIGSYEPQFSNVGVTPEPSTLGLLGLGTAMLYALRRRK